MKYKGTCGCWSMDVDPGSETSELCPVCNSPMRFRRCDGAQSTQSGNKIAYRTGFNKCVKCFAERPIFFIDKNYESEETE